MRLAKKEKKKKLVSNFIPTESGYKIPKKKKNSKKFKELKNIIPVLFQSKLGWDRLGRREKNFSPEFRSYPALPRKFQKK